MNHLKISSDEVFEALAEAFVKKLEHMQSQKRRLLNADDAAEYLGITTEAIYHLTRKGTLKPVRIDARSRFDIRDLDAFIESGKRE